MNYGVKDKNWGLGTRIMRGRENRNKKQNKIVTDRIWLVNDIILDLYPSYIMYAAFCYG